MGPLLLFMLSLYQLQIATHSELINSPLFNLNALSEREDDVGVLVPPEVDAIDQLGSVTPEDDDEHDTGSIPFVRTGNDQMEVEFRHPITSVNIDYSKNIILLKFRRERSKQRKHLSAEEEQKRRSIENNFMRFGRASSDFMRFGKREPELMPKANSIDHGFFGKPSGERYERSNEGMRDSRADNFMRFGKSPSDFMRLGRSQADFMRFVRNPGDFMRFGRGPATNFMRLGRSGDGDGSDNFMRFGRGSGDFMRFGRFPKQDFMRFGRSQKKRRQSDKDFMRFGRPDNFMRFGRMVPTTKSKEAANFMRFGKMDQNFMRFGKSAKHQSEDNDNDTKPLLQKSDVKAAAQLLQETEKNLDESNPVDKAIEVLFSKQRQQQQQEKHHLQENNLEEEEGEEGESDLESDYVANTAN